MYCGTFLEEVKLIFSSVSMSKHSLVNFLYLLCLLTPLHNLFFQVEVTNQPNEIGSIIFSFHPIETILHLINYPYFRDSSSSLPVKSYDALLRKSPERVPLAGVFDKKQRAKKRPFFHLCLNFTQLQ